MSIVTIFIVCIGPILVFNLALWLLEKSFPFTDGFRRCPHGFRGGIERCFACVTEKETKQKALEQARAERERLDRLQASAKDLRRREIARLSLAWHSNSDSYFNMDPRAFEDAIAEIFRRLGYRVEQTPYSNDHGKDAIAWKDNKKYVIECKRYGEDQQTGRRDIQILKAAMGDEKAQGGFFISTGRFTSTAIEYARKNRIELYDRTRLPTLVNNAYGFSGSIEAMKVLCSKCGCPVFIDVDFAKGEIGTRYCFQGHLVTAGIAISDLRIETARDAPLCPRCDVPMKIVRGSRGEFWGCSQYPRCRASKRIAKANRHLVARSI